MGSSFIHLIRTDSNVFFLKLTIEQGTPQWNQNWPSLHPAQWLSVLTILWALAGFAHESQRSVPCGQENRSQLSEPGTLINADVFK